MMFATRGPYLSSTVPTGKAEKFAVVDAIAKNKFKLRAVSDVQVGIGSESMLTASLARNTLLGRARALQSSIIRDTLLDRRESALALRIRKQSQKRASMTQP